MKQSLVEGAGEGLFSLIHAGEGEPMSFYNGVRVQHCDVDARDWVFNDNTISLDDKVQYFLSEPHCNRPRAQI